MVILDVRFFFKLKFYVLSLPNGKTTASFNSFARTLGESETLLRVTPL